MKWSFFLALLTAIALVNNNALVKAQGYEDDGEDEEYPEAYDYSQYDAEEDGLYDDDDDDGPDLEEDSFVGGGSGQSATQQLTQLDYHDFRSFTEGTLKATLQSIKASGEDHYFDLQKELQANFKTFKLPTVQIDLVHVNELIRPVYGMAYPEQTVPRLARDLIDADEKVDDPKRFESGNDPDFTFKANYEMMTNVFRNGISRHSANFKDTEQFPYEQDKFQKPIRSFTVTKTFDSKKNRWKTPVDFDKDRDMSRADQLQALKLDMQVDFAFSVNDVRFNSGLNKDFSEALQAPSATEFDLLQPFVADYELNHRQLAIYLVECDVYDCGYPTRRKFTQMAKLLKDTPIALLFVSPDKRVSANVLAQQIYEFVPAVIERRAQDLNEATESSDSPEIRDQSQLMFMKESLQQLDVYLEQDVFPQINKFKRSLAAFRFKSPLNFIMLGNDFHEFFGMFYHAKLLTQYLTNFLSDSVFSMHQLHEKTVAEGEELARHDYEVKQAAALKMKMSLQYQIKEAIDMLVEYDYLLQADQIDCSVYFPAERSHNENHDLIDDEIDFGSGDASQKLPSYAECWTRKYGTTLFSLSGIVLLSAAVFYCALGDIRQAYQQKKVGGNLID